MSVTFDVTPIFDCEGPWLRRSISTAYNQFTWEKFHSVLAYRGVAQNLMEWPICDIYVPAFLYVGTRRCWCWGSNSLGRCLEWMLLSTQLNRLCYFLGVWHHVSLVLALRLGASPWLLHFVDGVYSVKFHIAFCHLLRLHIYISLLYLKGSACCSYILVIPLAMHMLQIAPPPGRYWCIIFHI